MWPPVFILCTRQTVRFVGVCVHKDIIASFSVTRNQSHACYSVDLKLFVEFYTNKFCLVDQMFAISLIQAELIH